MTTTARATYSVPQAAQYLGVSTNHLWYLIRKGDVPGVIRLGKRVVISAEALHDFAGRDAASSPPVAPVQDRSAAVDAPSVPEHGGDSQ